MRLSERLKKIGISVSERNFYSTYEILEEFSSIRIETLFGRSEITLSKLESLPVLKKLSLYLLGLKF